MYKIRKKSCQEFTKHSILKTYWLFKISDTGDSFRKMLNKLHHIHKHVVTLQTITH